MWECKQSYYKLRITMVNGYSLDVERDCGYPFEKAVDYILSERFIYDEKQKVALNTQAILKIEVVSGG